MLNCELEPPGVIAWLGVAACDDDRVGVALPEAVGVNVEEGVAELDAVAG